MPRFYYYKHPETGKMYSDQRLEGFQERPLIINGIKCEYVPDYVPPKNDNMIFGIIDKNAEVFQKDPDYVRKCNPKYVTFRDGHKERYDPQKHR